MQPCSFPVCEFVYVEPEHHVGCHRAVTVRCKLPLLYDVAMGNA